MTNVQGVEVAPQGASNWLHIVEDNEEVGKSPDAVCHGLKNQAHSIVAYSATDGPSRPVCISKPEGETTAELYGLNGGRACGSDSKATATA